MRMIEGAVGGRAVVRRVERPGEVEGGRREMVNLSIRMEVSGYVAAMCFKSVLLPAPDEPVSVVNPWGKDNVMLDRRKGRGAAAEEGRSFVMRVGGGAGMDRLVIVSKKVRARRGIIPVRQKRMLGQEDAGAGLVGSISRQNGRGLVDSLGHMVVAVAVHTDRQEVSGASVVLPDEFYTSKSTVCCTVVQVGTLKREFSFRKPVCVTRCNF